MSETLSQRARALLNRLEERWGRVLEPRDTGASREALALELGDSGEPMGVPALLQLLLEGHERESQAVAMALHRLVWRAGPEEVLALDEVLRARAYVSSRWAHFQPEELGRFESLSPAVLALFTCHPNGHVREAAVRRLRGRAGGHAWPFLLVRLNDWVMVVRQVALDGVEEALGGVEPEMLARHLPLVARLGHVGRAADPSDFVRRARERLRAPDVRTWLLGHLEALPARSRREAYRLLLETEPQEARALVERGLEDPDMVVRGLVAGRVGELFRGEAPRALLERMERSRTAFVRREAYVLWARHFPDPTWRKLREALCDRHRQVREFAQYRLKGEADVAAIYRESLEEGPWLLGALAGLGETGRALDALLVEPYLTHPVVKVRREAVRAFARLGGEEVLERLRECFPDSSPSVTRAVARELAHGSGRVSLGWLRQWLAPGTPAHVRRTAVGMWGVLPHWDAPLLLLEAMATREERVTDSLWRWQDTYYWRFVQPTGGQLRALRDAVRDAPLLSEGLRLQLNHLLRAFEPF